MTGDAEAREKLKEVDMIKEIRNHPIKMTDIQAGPDNSYYVALMQLQDFKNFKKVIISAGKGLVTWEPAPIVKPQSELAVSEKPAKDTPQGWSAWLITNGSQQHGADLTFFLKRPIDASNKYKDKAMPPIANPGDLLKSQMVYFKIRAEVTVTEQILNALDVIRFKYTKGLNVAEMKRTILCGADQILSCSRHPGRAE